MAEAVVGHTAKRVAVVTGGNKGIGLEICRQLATNGVIVVLTARDEKRGVEAIENLRSSGLFDVIFHQLDVMEPASTATLAKFIKTQFGKLDMLVNNAAVAGATINKEDSGNLDLQYEKIVGDNAKLLKDVIKQSYEEAETTLRTNYYGVKQVTKELIPLLQLSDSARLVIVSSTMGQLKLISNERARTELGDVDGLTEERVDGVVKEFLEDMKESVLESKGWPIIFSAYIVSKATLNAYTRVLAKKYPMISINAVSPGFVKTDLNHNLGVLTVEEGAKAPVMLCLMPDGGPSGLFFDQMEVSTFD